MEENPSGIELNESALFWEEVLAPKFIRFRHIMVDGLSLHSEGAFEQVGLPENPRIVDIGCGFGDTAIEMARMAGPGSTVIGLDCSDSFLSLAREDAEKAGLRNVSFEMGDAGDYPFKADFDFCYSRFGTMFFDNPVAGLRNIRKALKDGGKLMMHVWRVAEDNPWLTLSKEVVLRHVPPPEDDGPSCGPGPFSMADPESTEAKLKAAGYDDCCFERIDAEAMVGRDLEDAVDFQLALGPGGQVFREAGDLALERESAIRSDLAKALEPFLTPRGVMMPSSSWRITARNPAP